MIRAVPARAQFSFRGGRFSPVARVGQIPGASQAVALASSAITDWMNSIQLSHDADTATTLIVNGLGQQLSNLDSAYLAEASPTCADQREALNAYDQAILWLQSPAACGNPAYGSAGNRCISDRIPEPWATYYRDPIANDPRVASLGCDTGQDVILPTVSSGYTDTGITSTGGSSTTGQTPAEIAAAALAASATPVSSTTPTTTTSSATAAESSIAGIPTSYVLVGAALLGGLLLLRSL
jgi:hypothetical protein